MLIIEKKWSKEKGWYDYSPLQIKVICADCKRTFNCLTYQIVEKEYHAKGKIFCAYCGGMVTPLEDFKVKKN